MQLFELVIVIGLIFSPIAAIMAFIISYEEYKRHYTDKKKPFQLSLGTAIATFVFFMLVSFFAGLLLNRIIR